MIAIQMPRDGVKQCTSILMAEIIRVQSVPPSADNWGAVQSVGVTLTEVKDGLSRARGHAKYFVLVSLSWSGEFDIVDSLGYPVQWTLEALNTWLTKSLSGVVQGLTVTIADSSKVAARWTDTRIAAANAKVVALDVVAMRADAAAKRASVIAWVPSERRTNVMSAAVRLERVADLVEIFRSENQMGGGTTGGGTTGGGTTGGGTTGGGTTGGGTTGGGTTGGGTTGGGTTGPVDPAHGADWSGDTQTFGAMVVGAGPVEMPVFHYSQTWARVYLDALKDYRVYIGFEYGQIVMVQGLRRADGSVVLDAAGNVSVSPYQTSWGFNVEAAGWYWVAFSAGADALAYPRVEQIEV